MVGGVIAHFLVQRKRLFSSDNKKEEYDFSGNGAKFVLLEMETRYNAGEV